MEIAECPHTHFFLICPRVVAGLTKYVCLSTKQAGGAHKTDNVRTIAKAEVVTRQVRSPAAFQASPARTRVSSASRR